MRALWNAPGTHIRIKHSPGTHTHARGIHSGGALGAHAWDAVGAPKVSMLTGARHAGEFLRNKKRWLRRCSSGSEPRPVASWCAPPDFRRFKTNAVIADSVLLLLRRAPKVVEKLHRESRVAWGLHCDALSPRRLVAPR